MNEPPPEGWDTDRWGNLIFVRHGTCATDSPPTRKGWECRFVARHGNYTRWSYRASYVPSAEAEDDWTREYDDVDRDHESYSADLPYELGRDK